ncbi:MAG: hypothetical protein Q9165_007039 [Trypethelium subeluteriae]
MTTLLGPVEDSAASNDVTDNTETKWEGKSLEAEAVMINPAYDEDDAWRHSSEADSKTDAYGNKKETERIPVARKKHLIADWQKNLSDKLSTWYPSSWGSNSADSHKIVPPRHGIGNDTTDNTTFSNLNETSSAVNYTLGDSLDAPPGSSLYRSAPRIAKCTISFNYNPVYERALRSHDAHNQLHNYPLYINRQSILDDVWTKPAWILALILRELARPAVERLEWLFWMDADTVLLNPYIPISAFLPPETGEFDDINLVVVHDFNGLNNGVFAIRVCQWSVQLLSAVLAFPHYKPDFFLLFRDQSAMDELLKERRFARNLVKAPQRWFNAYQGEHNETLAPFQVRRGDFLVHFAGVGDREGRMRYWLDRAEQHLPDWEIEYKQTSYPMEVRDFWTEVAVEKEARRKRLENVKARAKDVEELVEKRLGEFEERLSEEEKEKLVEGRDHMKDVMEKQESREDPDRIEEELQKLQEATKPLNEQAERANKVLMKEAQDAIFKAQDTTLKYTGTSEVENELTETDEKLSRLKELVLQSSWKKSEVKDSIDELRQAHALLSEKVEILEDKKKAEAEEVKEQEIRQAKLEAEKELKAQLKAEQAAEEEAKKRQENEADAEKMGKQEFKKSNATKADPGK